MGVCVNLTHGSLCQFDKVVHLNVFIQHESYKNIQLVETSNTKGPSLNLSALAQKQIVLKLELECTN